MLGLKLNHVSKRGPWYWPASPDFFSLTFFWWCEISIICFKNRLLWSQHWFRLWLDAEWTTSHYLTKWWPSFLRIYTGRVNAGSKTNHNIVLLAFQHIQNCTANWTLLASFLDYTLFQYNGFQKHSLYHLCEEKRRIRYQKYWIGSVMHSLSVFSHVNCNAIHKARQPLYWPKCAR